MRGALRLPVLLALLLPSSLAAQSPAAFEIRYETPGPLFTGVPVHLTITAIGADGSVLRDYAGTPDVEGLSRSGVALRKAPPFVEGVLDLRDVDVTAATVSVREGDAAGTSRRSRLPGWLTLLPPLLAITLAILTRQVILALFCGVWVGAFLLAGLDLPGSFLRSADTYAVNALSDQGHSFIVLFSLSLAGMVGIMTRSGGVRGIVAIVSRLARGPRSGQIATWLLGVLIFFDDYANLLIVGNTMRPFTDKVRISREKLSFIVDATAAPVATIGIVSTWTAYQLGVIADVLPQVGTSTDEPYLFFLRTIPESFYSFFMLFLVFLAGVTLRDFGPMRKAEARCRTTGKVLRDGASPLLDPALDKLGDAGDVVPRWYNAVIPVLCVIGFTLAGLYFTGLHAFAEADRPGLSLHEIVGRADAYRSLLWAALGSSVVAGVLALLTGYRLDDVMTSWVSGARSLVLAAMILVLAWSISAVCKDLHTGAYVASITHDILSARLVPALAFLLAGVIAFATGTSYGTMGILIPILLPLAYTLSAAGGIDPVQADRIGVGTLAAILGGSVFGDHCSPISDTTVLSSMVSGADHIDHVRTQLPYALLGALVSLPCFVLLGWGIPAAVLVPGGLALAGAAFWRLSR